MTLDCHLAVGKSTVSCLFVVDCTVNFPWALFLRSKDLFAKNAKTSKITAFFWILKPVFLQHYGLFLYYLFHLSKPQSKIFHVRKGIFLNPSVSLPCIENLLGPKCKRHKLESMFSIFQFLYLKTMVGTSCINVLIINFFCSEFPPVFYKSLLEWQT